MRAPAFIAALIAMICAAAGPAVAWDKIAVGRDGSIYATAREYDDSIQKFDSSGKFVAKWSLSVYEDGPFWVSGIATGLDGSVYVLNSWNPGGVHKFDANGNHLAAWKLNQPGSSPTGIAVDGKDNIYVPTNDSIKVYNPKGELVSSWGLHLQGAGDFISTSAITVDAAGNVYVAEDSGKYTEERNGKTTTVRAPARIQKLDSCGKGIDWSVEAGHFDKPSGLAVGLDGSVYVADGRVRRLEKFDSTGKFVGEWGGIDKNGEPLLPESVVVDSKGNFYIPGAESNKLKKFDPSMNLLAQWSMHGDEGSDNGTSDDISTSVDSAGNLYLADISSSRVIRYDPSGVLTSQWGDKAGIDLTTDGIAIGKNGTAYVVDSDSEKIRLFDSAGKHISDWGIKPEHTKDGCWGGETVCTDRAGNVYLFEPYTGRFREFDPTGKLISQTRIPIPKPKSDEPGMGDLKRMIADGKGNIYTASILGSEVEKLNWSGKSVAKWKLAGVGPNSHPMIAGIATDSTGNIYAADNDFDHLNNRVQEFDPSGKLLNTWKPKYAPGDKGDDIAAFAIDTKDNIYMLLGGHLETARVQMFSHNGDFIKEWRTWQPKSAK